MKVIINESQITNMVLKYLGPMKIVEFPWGGLSWRDNNGDVIFTTNDSKSFGISYDFFFNIKSMFSFDDEESYNFIKEVCEIVTGLEVEELYLRD